MAEGYGAPLSTVGGGEGSRCNYQTRLDVYGCGCSHNCRYCYARAMLEFRGNWHPDSPHVADMSKIRGIVSKLEPGSVVRMGGMTDCFQACESEYHAARDTIDLLNRRGVHQLIVTKSDSVARCETLDRRLSHIQISITSTSDEPNAFGENAPAPSKRMDAVRELVGRGFDVCVRLSPYVPELVDLQILRERTGCEKVLVEFLRVNGNIRKTLPGFDFRPYRLNLGGYRHLPLKVKRELLAPIAETFNELSVCEDVYSHWSVWMNEVNANPSDCCNLRI